MQVQLTFCMKNPAQYVIVMFNEDDCKVNQTDEKVVVALSTNPEIAEISSVNVKIVLTAQNNTPTLLASGDVDRFEVQLADVSWWTRSEGCNYPPFHLQLKGH